ARHLREGSLVLYDVSSSYYEGRHCPLAQYGHDRDGQKGLPIIVYGLLTDPEGRRVGGPGLSGQHGRSNHGGRPGKQVARALPVVAGGAGGRSGHADPAADSQAQSASRDGLDHGLDQCGDPRIAGRGIVATLVVRREESGRDPIAGISRGAVDGLLQPFAGGRTERQAGGVVDGDREGAGENRKSSGTTHEEADDDDRDCFEGGQGAGTLQDRQTLRAPDRGGEVQLGAAGGGDRAGSEV